MGCPNYSLNFHAAAARSWPTIAEPQKGHERDARKRASRPVYRGFPDLYMEASGALGPLRFRAVGQRPTKVL